jgi:hypothetical protein
MIILNTPVYSYVWKNSSFNLNFTIPGVCTILRSKLNFGIYVKPGSVVLLEGGPIKHRTDSIQTMELMMRSPTCRPPSQLSTAASEQSH